MESTAQAPHAPDPLAAGLGWSSAAAPATDDVPEQGEREEGRSARKRRAIMEAATTLFLAHGYQGTSMDDVAALAAVSKQTVYKNFADKERLFSDIILAAAARAEGFVEALPRMLDDSDDLQPSLAALARQYIAIVMQPRVLQLRRLVLGEAVRFPGLAREYYQRAPERVIAALAAQLRKLEQRGLLRLDDPLLAAGHFAFLLLGLPLDKAMFAAADQDLTTSELDRLAEAAVRVFLAAYGSP